jgi:hypothetical protein
MESADGTMNISFDEIHQINLTPVRRTSNYYYPPSCIIKTGKIKYHITSRDSVFRFVSSMLESSSEDVEFMSKFVHELHGILVGKGLNERIKFFLGESLFMALLFLYPIFLALPVIIGFQGSPIAVFITLGIYVFLILIVMKRKYNPIIFAEDIKKVSMYLR